MKIQGINDVLRILDSYYERLENLNQRDAVMVNMILSQLDYGFMNLKDDLVRYLDDYQFGAEQIIKETEICENAMRLIDNLDKILKSVKNNEGEDYKKQLYPSSIDRQVQSFDNDDPENDEDGRYLF